MAALNLFGLLNHFIFGMPILQKPSISLREIISRFQNGVFCSFCAGRRQILLTFFSNGGKFDGHSGQFTGQIDWRKLKDGSKDTCYWSKLSNRRSPFFFGDVDFDRYAGIFGWESVVYAFVIIPLFPVIIYDIVCFIFHLSFLLAIQGKIR